MMANIGIYCRRKLQHTGAQQTPHNLIILSHWNIIIMKICMLAYTFYSTDNRVRRYAESLVNIGHSVEVIALKENDSEANWGKLNGVNIYRIQKRSVNEKKKLDYLIRLILFFLRSSYFLTKKQLSQPYEIIHVHNMPDFLVFSAWYAKLTKAKIILDIHDIFPECYLSKFKKTKTSFTYRMLILLEKACVRFADHVIIANHIWEKTLLSRSVTKEKCTTILNYPDPKIFTQQHTKKDTNKFIMMYPGSLNWHQGLHVAINAIAIIKNQIPEAEFHIYGSGPSKESLKELIAQHNLEEKILFKQRLPLHKMANEMAKADMGIVPKVANSFGDEAFSTKIFEFMAMGLPVIVSDTKVDKFYFNDSLVKFFKSEDEQNLSEAMLLLIKNKKIRDELSASSSEFIKKHSWAVKENDYLDIINKLVLTS